MMDVVHTRAELATARARLQGSVALVPTMGALHEGHRTLLRHAREVADTVVVSIFVNPLQFGPGEDLDRYPRPLEADLAMCADEGVTLAFVPSRDEMYPREPVVRVCAGQMGSVFEGASRPGHFDGVLTVVAKLFGLVRPDIAVFGRKDAQQLALVRRMVTDLELPVRIEAAPLIRDADGLALSSRNKYLSAEERETALALSRALDAAAEAASVAPAAIVDAARSVLDQAKGVVTDYVALVGPDDFEPFVTGTEALIVVAARVGSTRLIDNREIMMAPTARPKER
ncbi:MAG TPA: pantoate--beta-alanine ligase [Acidothermaceae bacterium]|jgi:pantoate--beta-alanine ligase|nr:pantoate--beta-alanine ligase [Acidothermaceae bacterium]